MPRVPHPSRSLGALRATWPHEAVLLRTIPSPISVKLSRGLTHIIHQRLEEKTERWVMLVSCLYLWKWLKHINIHRPLTIRERILSCRGSYRTSDKPLWQPQIYALILFLPLLLFIMTNVFVFQKQRLLSISQTYVFAIVVSIKMWSIWTYFHFYTAIALEYVSTDDRARGYYCFGFNARE
jgi:hypothetical protein